MSQAESEMICDLAETYQIYDYQAFPLKTVETLVFGLRENSRTKMKISGVEYSTDQLLLAMITDKLSDLVWLNTVDGRKGINRPESITAKMLGVKSEEKKDGVIAFDSKEELDAALARVRTGEQNAY